MFAAHGSFAIEVGERILQVTIKGAWNLETALEYTTAINEAISPLRGDSWALISDLNDWELFTPDCFPIISGLVIQCIQDGLVREAIINSVDSVKMQHFKLRKDAFPEFRREIFKSRQLAEEWLRQEGFE